MKVKFTSGGKSRLTRGLKFTIYARLFVKKLASHIYFGLKILRVTYKPFATLFSAEIANHLKDHFFV